MVSFFDANRLPLQVAERVVQIAHRGGVRVRVVVRRVRLASAIFHFVRLASRVHQVVQLLAVVLRRLLRQVVVAELRQRLAKVAVALQIRF